MRVHHTPGRNRSNQVSFDEAQYIYFVVGIWWDKNRRSPHRQSSFSVPVTTYTPFKTSLVSKLQTFAFRRPNLGSLVLWVPRPLPLSDIFFCSHCSSVLSTSLILRPLTTLRSRVRVNICQILKQSPRLGLFFPLLPPPRSPLMSASCVGAAKVSHPFLHFLLSRDSKPAPAVFWRRWSLPICQFAQTQTTICTLIHTHGCGALQRFSIRLMNMYLVAVGGSWRTQGGPMQTRGQHANSTQRGCELVWWTQKSITTQPQHLLWSAGQMIVIRRWPQHVHLHT